MPEIHPMLATVAGEMPHGEGWVFEPKYDGIRILAVVNNGDVRLLSRNAIDRTGDFPEVADAVRALSKRSRLDALVLDGELVARTADGIGRFSDLQQRGKAITESRRAALRADRAAARKTGATARSAGRAAAETAVTLMVFDMLVAGKDVLLRTPWRARHDALRRLWRRARFRSVDGKLRHPVYLGLRDDKPPVAVHREAESLQEGGAGTPAGRMGR
jgi:bifunctional non-homologous end joining protein LigD